MTVLSADEPTVRFAIHHEGGQDALRRRILETAQLMDRRGYGVSLERFARLLYGGSEDPQVVEEAIGAIDTLSVSNGLVIQTDRRGQEAAMASRQATHLVHAADGEALARDFAARLVATCPLVKSVSLTGSIASGGFQPGDDVDLNMVTAPGAKYTVYLWALALSTVTSLRNRHQPADEMSPIPFLPKIICVNVVWEDGQVRPLTRQDKWIAYELLMHKPLLGAQVWEGVLAENRWMENHFPQVFEPGFVGGNAPEAEALSTKPRAGRGFFGFLGRHRRALAVVESLSRIVVIAVHKTVSLSRANKPDARERENFVNLVKRPYSVYDVPGREAPVPPEALRPRAPDLSANP